MEFSFSPSLPWHRISSKPKGILLASLFGYPTIDLSTIWSAARITWNDLKKDLQRKVQFYTQLEQLQFFYWK